MGSDKEDYTLGISILEQALANLTAVVSATALDIRALDESDIAHENLPYDLDWLANYKKALVVDEADTNDWNQTDDAWAEGENFYISQIVIWAPTDSQAFLNPIRTRYYQGIELYLWEGDPPANLLLYEVLQEGFFRRGSGVGPWALVKTYFFPRLIRVDDGNTLQVYVGNFTALKLNSFNMRIGGVSK